MPEGQREQVRSWLGDLIGDFPDARYVVTSRPAAISEGWLEELGFAASELQPMSTHGREGIHPPVAQAMAAEVIEADDRPANWRDYEQSLLSAIDG